MIRPIWIALLALLASVQPAQADELRPGYIEFKQVGSQEWDLVWKAPMSGSITPQTQPILPDGCKMRGSPRRQIEALSVISTFDVVCPGEVAGGLIGLSHFAGAQTDVLVRVAPLGRPVQVLRLTPSNASASILAKPDAWQVAKTYFVIGVEHILFGYDHLLFVLALVLLISGWRTVAVAVTAFTVAHSITLVGTILGYLGLPQRPVEAIIALSIVFLAVEIVKKRGGALRLSERAPWLVAFLFGLLHGFGFAGALKEIGLPESDVPTALLTFNLGVEAGQLMIVLSASLVLHGLRKWNDGMANAAVRMSAYGIGAIASMWLIERVVL